MKFVWCATASTFMLWARVERMPSTMKSVDAAADATTDASVAWDQMVYSVDEIKRITRVAAKIALGSNPPLAIHSVDKANVLATSRLWRKVVTETLKEEFPTITFDHQFVDSASMLIVANPKKLNGVLLTENLFGDM